MTSTRITARIDLSRKKILEYQLDKTLAAMFLGGHGINSALCCTKKFPQVSFYGISRGLALKFIPLGGLIFGYDLARTALNLEGGIELGSFLLTRDNASVLLLLFMFPFMISMEMYFRGLLFQTARKYVHWAWAVAIA